MSATITYPAESLRPSRLVLHVPYRSQNGLRIAASIELANSSTHATQILAAMCHLFRVRNPGAPATLDAEIVASLAEGQAVCLSWPLFHLFATTSVGGKLDERRFCYNQQREKMDLSDEALSCILEAGDRILSMSQNSELDWEGIAVSAAVDQPHRSAA